MASVFKESRGKRVSYRIQFVDGDKRRRKIRVNLPKKDAQAVSAKVEALNSAKISGRALDADTSRWVAELGQELAEKLSDAGLIAPRRSAKLGAFIDSYIDGRTEAEANTVRNWKNSRRKLTDFFGEDRDLRHIYEGEADDWRQALVDKGLSGATISKAVKHAKQFFKYGVRQRLCNANPFQELKAGGEHNPERKAFITPETIETVLEACPDIEWKLIVALARYGGLRVPSELLALRWCDIDWERDRFTVTSRKTKRHGKAWRTVPIFPELKQYLADAFDNAAEGSVYVIARYRGENANIRTQFMRILKNAGVTPWERLFHNLRASRQTELENQFPAHVVCDWLGNSESVARKHYLQTTEDHFTSAIGTGGATGGARVAWSISLSHSRLSCCALESRFVFGVGCVAA
jgi:integrase